MADAEKLIREEGYKFSCGSAEQALGNLLAVIHRDGGQYLSEHGREKATQDAAKLVQDMRWRIDADTDTCVDCARDLSDLRAIITDLVKCVDTLMPGIRHLALSGEDIFLLNDTLIKARREIK